MNTTLSVATSADHYIDDPTPQRLTLSTPSDWQAVYALRRRVDAILIGGETLRRDNPTLGLKGEQSEREPMRIVISGRGEISAEAKIFHKGSGEVVIFSQIERPELEGLARVITLPTIDVPIIITTLEKMGISSLLVEGGAKILDLFLRSGMVTSLRLAVNPTIRVEDERAPRFELPKWIEQMKSRCEQFEEMVVTTYSLAKSSAAQYEQDLSVMSRVIEYSHNSPPKESCYRVGAAVVTRSGEEFFGYTLETAPTHHAEQAAIHKALKAGAELTGATIYASMEPCSQRSSEKESCSQIIIREGIKRVVFALYEPSHFVECHGAENLRRAGVEVVYLSELSQEVRRINCHVLKEE